MSVVINYPGEMDVLEARFTVDIRFHPDTNKPSYVFITPRVTENNLHLTDHDWLQGAQLMMTRTLHNVIRDYNFWGMYTQNSRVHGTLQMRNIDDITRSAHEGNYHKTNKK